jgi:hypothetical protein
MKFPEHPLFKISKGQQICFVVYDLESWMERMWKFFGIGPWKVNLREENSEREDCDIAELTHLGKQAHFGYKLASARLDDGIIIELIQPTTDDSTFSDFLKEHGEGMHHIGWHFLKSYEEYVNVSKMLEENGFKCLQSSKKYDAWMAYFDTTKVLGTILEISFEDPTKQKPAPLAIYPKPE